MQVSERRTIQQDELVKQLQDKVSSTVKMAVDIALFQAQALEVLKKLEIKQQSLFYQGRNNPKSFSGSKPIFE